MAFLDEIQAVIPVSACDRAVAEQHAQLGADHVEGQNADCGVTRLVDNRLILGSLRLPDDNYLLPA